MQALFDQRFTFNHTGLTTPYAITFSVPENINQLRIQCESSLFELQNHQLEAMFAKYTNHHAINDLARKNLYNQFFSRNRDNQMGFVVHYFDPEGQFRGGWNAHNKAAKVIGTNYADPGCVAGSIQKGLWQVVILVPPAGVTIHLKVRIDGSEAVLNHPLSAMLHSIPTPPQLVSSKAEWHIGEMYERSNRSGGKLDPEGLLSIYEQFEYNFLFLIDPDTQPLSGICQENGLAVFSGQEIFTPTATLRLLGTRNFIAPYSGKYFRPLEQIVRETHLQGGLIMMAQPYAVSQTGRFPACRINPNEWSQIDLIEVWSGMWRAYYPEILNSLDLWDHLLNQDLKIFAVCGKGERADLNEATEEQIPKMIVQCQPLTETALLTALKRGHAYITCEPAVALWVESSTGTAQMGDELAMPEHGTFLLQFRCTQIERGFVRIKTNQGTLLEMQLRSQRDTEEQFILQAKPGLQWFRAEIYRYDRPIDELLALTNPVFVRGMLSG